MISGCSVVVAAKEQISSPLDGEVVILNLNRGGYYGLDTVGVRIWNLLQEPRAVNAIRDVILKEYEVGADCCERDLIALLMKLAEEGLIEVSDERDP